MALAPEPTPAGRVLDARLHLLDRQILDRNGVPVATVDDIEFTVDGDQPSTVRVAHLLTGSSLATRIFGGRPPTRRMVRVPWRHVVDVAQTVRLAVDGSSLDATWAERWVRDHIIARIPEGRHDPQ